MSVEQYNRPAGKTNKPFDLSTFKVLIAEDFSFIANLLASTLTEMGVGKVMVVPGGNPGKEKLLDYNATISPTNIDVLILDWLMPNGSGLEFLQWIRSHRSDAIRFLPVIVCSAYTSEALVKESRDNGANEVMVKPISAEKLAHRIAYVIEHPRPYIKSEDFFGPDRRRKERPFTGDDMRKTKPEDIKVHDERYE